MPDKKDKLKEVTDPKLLEQLNTSSSSEKEVTDPSLLAQLNGDEPQAQKKSPDATSANGSAPSSQGGPQASSPNNQPNATISNIGNPAPAPVTTEAATPYDVIGRVFGKTPEGQNVIDPSKNIQPSPEAAKAKLYQSTKFLADNAIQNASSLPQSYTQNYTNPNTDQPGNLLHDITNPHGDPEHTGSYAQTMVSQLEQQKQKAIQEAGYNNPQMASGLSDYGLSDINKKYNDQIAQIKSNASQVISAQLFNKEYAQKPLSGAEAATKLDALEKQKEADISSANKQMQEDITTGDYKYKLDQADALRRDKIKQINNRYNLEVLQVKNSEKWDAVRLGIKHQKLLGDQDAIRDAANLDAGKPISPAAKYKYQLIGNEILKTGSQLAEANGQTPVAQQAKSHIKTDKQLENDNLDYFIPQWEQAIGNAKYADGNDWIHAIVPHIGSVSKDDVNKYGEQAGLTKSQIDKVDPAKVPTSATLWQQFAGGMANTAAPLYENFIGKPLMRASGASDEEINQHFQPGWENQRGLAAGIVGNIPSDQNSFHNVRGALGQVLSGAGALATFGGEVGVAAKGAEAIGLASDAAKAEKLANFGVMSFNGYNSAYHDANEAIGDKPEDEWKRQAYAVTRGILEAMIFSGGSKYELAKNTFGETMGKSGDQLLDEIKNAKDVGVLQSPTFKEAIVQKIMASGSELGKQVKLSVANDMAKDVVNTIVNPNKKQDISEDIKNTAISTLLAMLIPSMIGGIRHVNNETPLNTAAAFEIGSHPQQYLATIDKQYQEGKITRQDLSTMRGAIGALQYAVSEAPTETPDGQKLTPDQIKAYAFNRFQEHLLLLKQDRINKTATDNKMQPDKTLLEPVNKRISELEKQRGDILKNAGQLRPPTPQPEEPNQAPADERSVATDDKSAPQTSETKKEEKLAENQKENIPLSSDITSQSKTEDHGNNDEEKIVNNGIDNQREEVNPNSKENDNNQGAEDRQNGELKTPTEENKNQPQAAEVQPLPVEGKRPVKKFGLKPKTEEQIPIQKNDAFEAMDLGDQGGKPIDEVKAKIDAADPYEKIGGGESFDDFKERIRKAWQKTKKTAEDQTLLQTHSGVMRMIEAAEKHGWTDVETLKKAYDATEEPEVGERHTYKTDNGEIHVMRHGESEDLKAELARRPEDPLTPEGRRQAKEDIAGHLKEEGIAPPAIIADGMPRTAETAKLVQEELGKSDNSAVEKNNTFNRDTIMKGANPLAGKDFKGVSDKEVTDNLKVGDSVTFYAEKERKGTWNGRHIKEDKTQNPWGVLGVLGASDGWIRNDSGIKRGLAAKEKPQEKTPSNGAIATLAKKENQTPATKENDLGGKLKNSIPEDKRKDVFLASMDEIKSIQDQQHRRPAAKKNVSTMETEGIKEPVEVYVSTTDGKMMVRNGNHRIDEADRLGAENIPVHVTYVKGKLNSEAAKKVELKSLKPKEEPFDFEQLFNQPAAEGKPEAEPDQKAALKEKVHGALNAEIKENEKKLAAEVAKGEVKENKGNVFVGGELEGKNVNLGALNAKKREAKKQALRESVFAAEAAKRIAEENGFDPERINAAQDENKKTKQYKGKTAQGKMLTDLAYEKAWETSKKVQGEKPQEKTPPNDLAAAPEKKPETKVAPQSSAAENRKKGSFVKDGVTYTRNEKQTGPIGKEGSIEFSKGVDKPFQYQLVEADQLQPASQDGNRNPNHFIPEAQPKQRTDAASKESAERIAGKPDLGKVGEAPNAYSGAPVVNTRGEVIQGNNRAEGLVKHYDQKGTDYKKQLAENAEKFGLKKEDVEGMKNPVLVRRVEVGDEEAIKLGNYDVKDIETGGKNRIDPVATSRRIPMKEKQKIVDALIKDGEDKTLNQSVRDNFDRVIKLLKDHLRPAQLDALTNRSGDPSSEGLQDVEKLITHFLFDQGDVNLPDHFEGLSDAARKGMIKAFPKIFSVKEENSLLPEIQNALIAHEDFKTSNNPSFGSWKTQADMFAGGKAPKDTYTPLELKMAEAMAYAKTQKEVNNLFAEYAEKVNGKPGDMFGGAEKPIDKAEAIKQVFKVPYNEKQSRNERAAQEAPRVEEEAARQAIFGEKPEPEKAKENKANDRPDPRYKQKDPESVKTNGARDPEKRDAMVKQVAEETGDFNKGFHEAGYKYIDGMWVDPAAEEMYNSLSPEMKALFKERGINYFTDFKNNELGKTNNLERARYEVQSMDGKDFKGISFNSDKDALALTKDSIEADFMHEIGHDIWANKLTDEQKALFQHENPNTQHGKDVKEFEEGGGQYGHNDEPDKYQEEDFAELFKDNNGDLDKTLATAKEQQRKIAIEQNAKAIESMLPEDKAALGIDEKPELGSRISDIHLEDQSLNDFLDSKNLDAQGRKSIEQVFEGRVGYYDKFDKKSFSDYLHKFINPEDITDYEGFNDHVGAASESDYYHYQDRNFSNVKDGLKYISDNPKEYGDKTSRAASELLEKLDNSSSGNRLYAVDVRKELGIPDVTPKSIAEQYERAKKSGSDPDFVKKTEKLLRQYEKINKKLNQKQKPNGAIATPAKPEPELPSQKTGKQLDEISKQIAEQQAIIKKSFDSIPKDGEDKVGVWQDHLKETEENEKQIADLKKQFNQLEERQRLEQYRERDHAAAEKIAIQVKSSYDLGKKDLEDENYAGIIGISKNIKNHVSDYLVGRTADGLKDMQTAEMAIRRAIRQTKEKYGKEAEDLSEKDINAIKEHLDLNEKVPSHEPSLPFDYEDDVKGIKDDIQAGRTTYEEAVHDVMNGEYYNRAGKLLSEHNAENVKDKILSYLNWHEEGRAIHNAELADANNKNRVISDYGLKNGDVMTRMLSGDTIELRTGDEPMNEQQAIKYSLEGAALDAQAMVSKMKHHFGNDVTEYGPEMLKQIDKLPGGDTVKRVTALLGLMDELRKDQDIYEDHLANLGYSDKDVAERRATNERLSQIPKMLKKAEKTYQDTQREASKTINTGRIMAKLFSGKFAHELLADEAILPEKDREAKKQVENNLADTKIPDEVVKQGPLFPEEEANAAVEKAQQQMTKKEAPETPKDTVKEKAQNVIKKVTEAVTKKKAKDKTAAEQLKKDAEVKLAKKGMNESNMFDKIKELLKKNPC